MMRPRSWVARCAQKGNIMFQILKWNSTILLLQLLAALPACPRNTGLNERQRLGDVVRNGECDEQPWHRQLLRPNRPSGSDRRKTKITAP